MAYLLGASYHLCPGSANLGAGALGAKGGDNAFRTSNPALATNGLLGSVQHQAGRSRRLHDILSYR
jgi:hypothetical protein